MIVPLLIVLLPFLHYTNDNKLLEGKLIAAHKNTDYNIAYVFIIIKSNNSCDTVLTDENGRFSFKFRNEKIKNIDISYMGVGFGTIYLKHLDNNTEDVGTNLEIQIPTVYKKNILGKAYCPKCMRTDKVYEIRYGDAPMVAIRIDKKGDTTYSKIHDGIYDAGTCISSDQSAQWFCDRDKIEF
jgi:hypothetical protein